MSEPITRGTIAASKNADEVLDAIIAYVRPDAEMTMWLTEVEPKKPGDSNWNAGAEPMAPALLGPFLQIVETMRANYPIVVWGEPADSFGSFRRIYNRRGGKR